MHWFASSHVIYRRMDNWLPLKKNKKQKRAKAGSINIINSPQSLTSSLLGMFCLCGASTWNPLCVYICDRVCWCRSVHSRGCGWGWADSISSRGATTLNIVHASLSATKCLCRCRPGRPGNIHISNHRFHCHRSVCRFIGCHAHGPHRFNHHAQRSDGGLVFSTR